MDESSASRRIPPAQRKPALSWPTRCLIQAEFSASGSERALVDVKEAAFELVKRNDGTGAAAVLSIVSQEAVDAV